VLASIAVIPGMNRIVSNRPSSHPADLCFTPNVIRDHDGAATAAATMQVKRQHTAKLPLLFRRSTENYSITIFH
jgi:hypothetical protein